ncbi:unnamed protein product [Caenorhabditis auriculariae]|uniref:Protein amnionless n=1 Tax=Caenorhabditis auriculariae TaxID=2777116 RepID=A0A8S1HE03_9PELO|nr:unnamed protein product [Caenorhabditis auriculariae]
MVFIWLIVLLKFVISERRFFLSKHSNWISLHQNWQNGDIPCRGDHVRFEEHERVVAFMDSEIEADQIVLPNDGVLTFPSDGVRLGMPAKWQCEARKTPEDVFFKPDPYSPSFFDPKTWESPPGAFLHMHQVPSVNDDILLPTISVLQLYMDVPGKVNSITWYDDNLSYGASKFARKKRTEWNSIRLWEECVAAAHSSCQQAAWCSG